MSTKYTKEVLEDAVANSLSFAGVLRELGLKQAGGTQSHIARKVREFGIDTSHFTGAVWNKGTVSPTRKTAEQVLIVLPEGSLREKVFRLRRALKDLGVDEVCVKCYTKNSWNGEPLQLEVDHINGNWLDNRLENLRFLCPNCHSQQPTNKSWKNSKPV